MRVLLSGYHNIHFVNSTVYREKAIERLEHELIRFEDRNFVLPQRLFVISALYQWELRRINADLMRTLDQAKPDVCLVIGGQRILSSTVAAIKKRGIKTALWTTDVPFDFKNILQAAPFYDGLFCAGTEAQDIFRTHGLAHAQWVPFACDPQFHHPRDLTEHDRKIYGHDIVFVGSYYPNRARILEALAGFDLHVWGPYWNRIDRSSPLRSKITDVKLNYDQWTKIYAAAKIVIVSHYQNPPVPCHQASPKLFEAMACGAFVLCDSQKDAQRLFKDGEHVVFFRDSDDLKNKVDFYLNRPDRRTQIARQGQIEVVARHRYEDRLRAILSQLTGHVKGQI